VGDVDDVPLALVGVAVDDRPAAVAFGVNTVAGKVTNEPVAEFLGVDYVEPLAAFAG